MTTSTKPKLATIFVGNLLKEKQLKIPEYQRPYKWQEKHCKQLLNDLVEQLQKSKKLKESDEPINLIYRLGTVVIHNKDNELNIVDGQQRLITLSLILNALGETEIPLLEEKVSLLSQERLKANYQIIQNFIKEITNKNELEALKEFIREQCELVYVELASEDEAFQFFDSQNARGKSLAPYDLLKAYHLRSMHNALNYHIYQAVENWETAVYPKQGNAGLDLIISRHLFSLRAWYRYQSAYEFGNEQIDLFKGVERDSYYPYLQAQSGFQIQNAIVNGKSFFDYVDHYRQLYDAFFHQEEGWLNQYVNINNEPILTFLNSYTGCNRTGDRYVFHLFTYTVLQYIDRFGIERLKDVAIRIFKWAYYLRLKNTRIGFQTIEKYAKDRNQSLLMLIWQADKPQEVLDFDVKKPEIKFTNVGELKNEF